MNAKGWREREGSTEGSIWEMGGRGAPVLTLLGGGRKMSGVTLHLWLWASAWCWLVMRHGQVLFLSSQLFLLAIWVLRPLPHPRDGSAPPYGLTLWLDERFSKQQACRMSLFVTITPWQLPNLYTWWGREQFFAASCIACLSSSDHCHPLQGPSALLWHAHKDTFWKLPVPSLFPLDCSSLENW